MEERFAGGEAEIATRVGLFGDDDEAQYLGIGSDHQITTVAIRVRFRNVRNEMGLLGARAAWACNTLRILATYAKIMNVCVG